MQVAERLRPCAPPMKYAETLKHCVPAIMNIADNRWLCARTERRIQIFQLRRAVASHNGMCQARRRWRRETLAPQLSSPASMSAVAVPQTCDLQLTPLVFRDRKKNSTGFCCWWWCILSGPVEKGTKHEEAQGISGLSMLRELARRFFPRMLETAAEAEDEP